VILGAGMPFVVNLARTPVVLRNLPPMFAFRDQEGNGIQIVEAP
jgi:hypothetical protein